MDGERTGVGGGQTRHCQQYFTSSCGAFDEGSRFETAPVAVLVESPPDPQFDEKVQDICDCYLNAIERDEQRERTISIDEMTGIQALERKFPDQPMRPGKRERQEFEYIRHGTQTGTSPVLTSPVVRWFKQAWVILATVVDYTLACATLD